MNVLKLYIRYSHGAVPAGFNACGHNVLQNNDERRF